jgi:hypothetical protein
MFGELFSRLLLIYLIIPWDHVVGEREKLRISSAQRQNAYKLGRLPSNGKLGIWEFVWPLSEFDLRGSESCFGYIWRGWRGRLMEFDGIEVEMRGMWEVVKCCSKMQ